MGNGRHTSVCRAPLLEIQARGGKSQPSKERDDCELELHFDEEAGVRSVRLLLCCFDERRMVGCTASRSPFTTGFLYVFPFTKSHFRQTKAQHGRVLKDYQRQRGPLKILLISSDIRSECGQKIDDLPVQSVG